METCDTDDPVLALDSWSERLIEAHSFCRKDSTIDVTESVAILLELMEESTETIKKLCSVEDPMGGNKAATRACIAKQKSKTFDADLWRVVEMCARALVARFSNDSLCKESYTIFEHLLHQYRQNLESIATVVIRDKEQSSRTMLLADLLAKNVDSCADFITSKGIFFLFSAGKRCISCGLLRDASSLLTLTLKAFWHWSFEQCVCKQDTCRLAYSFINKASISFEFQRNFRSALACRTWMSQAVQEFGDHTQQDVVWVAFRLALLACLAEDSQKKEHVRKARELIATLPFHKQSARLSAGGILDVLECEKDAFAVIAEYIDKTAEADEEKPAYIGQWKEEVRGLETIRHCTETMSNLALHCSLLIHEEKNVGEWTLTVINVNQAAFHRALARAPMLIESCPAAITTEEHLQVELNAYCQASMPALTPAAMATCKVDVLLAMGKNYFKQEKLAKVKSLVQTALSMRSSYCPKGYKLNSLREGLGILLNVALQEDDTAAVQLYCGQMDNLNANSKYM